MHLDFIVCAQSAVIDQATNNLSIHNIFEEIGAPIFPVAITMSVVAHLKKKKSEKENQALRLVFSLDNDQIGDQPINVAFQDKLVTRIIARIQPLVLQRPGILKVEIKQKNSSLGVWIVQIYKAGEELFLQSIPASAAQPAAAAANRATRRAAKSAKK